VAKLNGDIRVAFDMMKGAFNTLAVAVNSKQSLPLSEIRVTLDYILKVYESKYGNKVG
jgi:hypothetical protein